MTIERKTTDTCKSIGWTRWHRKSTVCPPPKNLLLGVIKRTDDAKASARGGPRASYTKHDATTYEIRRQRWRTGTQLKKTANGTGATNGNMSKVAGHWTDGPLNLATFCFYYPEWRYPIQSYMVGATCCSLMQLLCVQSLSKSRMTDIRPAW